MVHVILGDNTYCQIKTRCPKGSQLGELYLTKQHLFWHYIEFAFVENTKTGRESTVRCEFVFG